MIRIRDKAKAAPINALEILLQNYIYAIWLSKCIRITVSLGL